MRKELKYGALALLFAFIGCTDEVEDLQPFVNGNPETFFTTVQSFQLGVDGAHAQLRNYYANPGSGYQGLPDILSDNVVLAATGRQSNDDYYEYRFVANTLGAIRLYFSEGYEAVNAANLVIGQIDNLVDGAPKNNILGQALAIRAMAHFDMGRIYGQIPTQSAGANASLGITYVKVEDGDTGDPFALPERETVGSNYAEIIGDLEQAAQLIGTDNGEGRMNRNAVYGLLSRVYLYNGQWQDAIDAANQVDVAIATAVAPDVDTLSELAGMYRDENNAGIVFELSINTTTEQGSDDNPPAGNNVGVLYSQSTVNSAGEIEATRSEYAIEFEFFNSIDDNDLRKDIMQFVGLQEGNEYNAVLKFLGEGNNVNGRVDIKVIRAAEVLLNKAEAQFELGLEAEALATLDELRDDRFTSYTGGETGQALEDAIQFNRRVELCFEGHRFFDIKRRGESLIRSNNGDLIDGTGALPVTLEVPAGNFRFQLPIPFPEINANPNMQQNDGY